MQRHREGQLSGARRNALSILSWLALAGSLTSSALAVRSWHEDRSASPPVAAIAESPPVAAAPPVREVAARVAPTAPAPEREIEVLGTVRSEGGDVLPGARVRASHTGEQRTDGSGRYALRVPVFSGETPMLYFTAPAHEPDEMALRPAQLLFDAVEIDVALVPTGTRTVVSGRIRGPRGEPVAGETAQLQAPKLRALHAGVTDARGAFRIPGVRVGARYDLVVLPEGPYADHWERGLRVPPDGLELDIELTELRTGRLEGRIVDAQGRPVPGFALSLRSTGARDAVFAVEADATGRFVLEQVPIGRLNAATHEPPIHVIRGLASEGREVEIVVDAGPGRLEGRVLDERGGPVAGVPLDLAWLHRSGGVRSSSVRRGVSGSDGRFRFDGLGPGPHRLIAGEDAPAVLEVRPEDGPVELRLGAADR